MNETVRNDSLLAPHESNGEASNEATSNLNNNKTTPIFVVSHGYEASYNIPPTSEGVIVYMKHIPGAENEYVLEPLKFGLLPKWAKPTSSQAVKRGNRMGPEFSREVQQYQSKFFNCRKETISQDKSVWTLARNSSRCVVPIQGYFEWQKTKSDKKPYFVHSKHSPLIFLAGLYSHNVNYNETDLVSSDHHYFSSFSIATGPSSGKDSNDLSWLHPRKPIFLKPNTPEWFEWLDPNVPWHNRLLDTALNCDTNIAYEGVTAYLVSSLVGNPSYKGPEAIQEVKVTQKSINQFFSPSPKKKERIENKDYGQPPPESLLKKEPLPGLVTVNEAEKAIPAKRRRSIDEGTPSKECGIPYLGSENYMHRKLRDYDEDDEDDGEDEGDE